MTDTLWSDISEFQTDVNNAYPYHFLALRSHDGGHNDLHFMANVTWANNSVKSGRLWGYIVYYFYRPGFDGAASSPGRSTASSTHSPPTSAVRSASSDTATSVT